MNLHKRVLTNNDCYKAGKKITVKKLMLHSTGVNNPKLSRYVDAPALGTISSNHWNQPKPGGREVCVHGFIGRDRDGNIATYQTLDWNHRGWGGGGSSNDTHIHVEICEDDLTDSVYFNEVYKEAVELFAYLCKEFNLSEKDIDTHSEGYKKGIASNHADVMHWFPKHGKTMDMFRADVAKALTNKNGWKKENDIWYFYTNGKKEVGWIKVKEIWYYLDAAGAMKTGWLKDKGVWYYLNPNGDMRIGWLLDKDKWYYLNPDGSMATGEITVKGKKYYLQTSGAMAITDPNGAIK